MALSLNPLARPSILIDGLVHPDFESVAEALRQQLNSYPGGAAVCIYHRGKLVADLWGGYRDEAGTPWSEDTMAPSFSTTKGVASTLLHIYADRGLIDYDAKVADYWPEFAQAGKHDITVRHVLTHQSGLYHIRDMIDHADRMLDWNHMIHAIEHARPAHSPGTRTGYHGLTYGFIVGEIIQRVSGKDFSRLVQTEIAEPLHLDGMYIGTPEQEIARAAELMLPKSLRSLIQNPALQRVESYAKLLSRLIQQFGGDSDLASIFEALGPRGISGFEFGSPESLRSAIPAANGLFTARSLAKMYAMLANGGEIDGTRLLSNNTVAQASRLQKAPNKHSVIPFDMRWRLGYHAIATTRGIPKCAFGHFGFGGSGAWADATTGLSVALIVNSGMGSPFGDTRTARISGAALAAARRREARHGWLSDLDRFGLAS